MKERGEGLGLGRSEARTRILRAANKGRRANRPPYTLRTLHQAVARVRNRGLVGTGVLVDAGFNAKGPNHRRHSWGPWEQ